MGKDKGEMVVADDDFREHVRATIYWGKDNDGGGKGKGKNEVGKGKNGMVVADDDFRKHVRFTIYCGMGKGTGKDDMASDVGQGTGKDHSPKSEQLEDAEALQTPRECSRETVECAEEPAQDGDSPRSTHVAWCPCQFCCPYLHDRLPRKYEAV